MTEPTPSSPEGAPVHRRRPRYAGKYPRKFEDKYKEHAASQNPETIEKVIASGKTPAGTHRPIMVAEILEVLAPNPGDIAVDCTLGFGGHSQEILSRIVPGGLLIGLDQDPIEMPRTEQRLRALGYGPESFRAHRSNFAGLGRVLAKEGIAAVDLILADLGVSSMQIDDPRRGFSVKLEGPLDMRMNPDKGQPASVYLRKVEPGELRAVLEENADEPFAGELANALAGREFSTTLELARAVRDAYPRSRTEDRDLAVRRVFQALRIAVNEEFNVLDLLLRQIPDALKPGGRVAILTFHSGEDRRVKKAFQAGLREGTYSEVSDVLRPSPAERHSNPRSSPAKLRWARKS